MWYCNAVAGDVPCSTLPCNSQQSTVNSQQSTVNRQQATDNSNQNLIAMFKGLTDRFSTLFSWFTGRYAPAFVTLVVLAGIFYFYSTVIVSSNESALKERNFRGLHRMADNISKKISSYAGKNSLNFFKAEKVSTDSGYQAFLLNEYGFEKKSIDTSAKAKKDSVFLRFEDGWKLFFRDSTGLQAFVSIENFAEPLLRR